MMNVGINMYYGVYYISMVSREFTTWKQLRNQHYDLRNLWYVIKIVFTNYATTWYITASLKRSINLF